MHQHSRINLTKAVLIAFILNWVYNGLPTERLLVEGDGHVTSSSINLLGVTFAHAYIRSRSKVKTSSVGSLKSIGEEETLPDFQARPFDGGLFQWSIVAEEGNSYLEANFSYNGDYYASVGIMSEKKMRGPIIVCYVNSTVQADSFAVCLDYHGGDYDMQRAPTFTDIVAASVTDAGGVYLTFRRLIRRTNQSSIDLTNYTLDLDDEEPTVTGQIAYDVNNPIEWDTTSRVIFAKGKFLDSAKRPKQHEADDVKAVMINWNTGKVTQLSSTRHIIVLGVSGGVLLLMMLMGYLIHRTPRIYPAWVTFARRFVLAGIFIAFCAGYGAANYLDYKDTVTSKAHVRALGDAAAFAFVCMMICSSRRVVMEFCFGIAPERAVMYHGLACGIFFAVATAHGIGMLYYFGLSWSIRWRDKDHVSKLPGIISYLLCVPVILFALVRNNSSLMWKMYKHSHALHVPIVFFMCCHYTKLVYGLIPPALFVLLDVLYERFQCPYEEDADIIAVCDPASQCTILRVYTDKTCLASQWFKVQVPAVSRDYHPLYAAIPLFYDNDDPYLEFIIKNTCDVTDQSWSREKDRKVLEERKKGNNMHLPLRSSSWTSSLYHTVLKNKKAIERVRLRGPIGCPLVNPLFSENIIYIAGGIGIAPILSQLTALTCGYHPRSVDVGHQSVVSLLWVIPNTALLNLYGHYLAQCKMFLKLLNPRMAVTFKVYVTNSRAEHGLPTAPVTLPPEVLIELSIIYGRRPDLVNDITLLQRLIDANASWSTTEDGKIEASSDGCAAFICGPELLATSARTVFEQRNKDAAPVNAARDPTKQRAMTKYTVGVEAFSL